MATEIKLKQLFHFCKTCIDFEGISDKDLWAACLEYQDRSDNDIDEAMENLKEKDRSLRREMKEKKDKVKEAGKTLVDLKEKEKELAEMEMKKAESLLNDLF